MLSVTYRPHCQCRMNIEAWSPVAEQCEAYLRKGMRVQARFNTWPRLRSRFLINNCVSVHVVLSEFAALQSDTVSDLCIACVTTFSSLHACVATTALLSVVQARLQITVVTPDAGAWECEDSQMG